MRCLSIAPLPARAAPSLQFRLFAFSIALAAVVILAPADAAASPQQIGIPPDTVDFSDIYNLPEPNGPEEIYNGLSTIDLNHCQPGATEEHNEGCYARICLPAETVTHFANFCQTEHWAYFSGWFNFAGGICSNEAWSHAVSNGVVYQSADWGEFASGLGDETAAHDQFCANARTPDDGCFDPESKILMSDGTTKPAAEIAVGDRLYNPAGAGYSTVVKVIESPEPAPMIEYGYETLRSRVTRTHPVPTSTGLKQAQALTVGDYVADIYGNYHRLSHVAALPVADNQTVINFIIEASDGVDKHLLVADDIVTGDLVLQQQLSRIAKR